MNTHSLNCIGKPIIASYIRTHQTGNPLVDALPPIKSDEDWYQQLLSLPPFDASQRSDPEHLRAYHVINLKEVFLPSQRHLMLARRIDQLIRWGYRKRDPLMPEHSQKLQHAYDQAQGISGKRLLFGESSPICGSSLMGMSGMGKSTTIEAILHAYPQYIFHPAHDLSQVVWLRVDCPRDGSLLELGMSILRAFDRVLGTKHAQIGGVRSPSAASVKSKVIQLALSHCLGLLVIDEIQNLSVKKSGGREEMLNWFQELVNELRLPVFLLGTFKAKSVMQLDVRHARRNTVMGSAVWEPMKLDADFRQLLQILWKYLWLAEPGTLTDELVETIFEETQGISAFVVDMLLITQLYALRAKKETITPTLFRHVARTEFKPVQPVLNALRSKDPGRLRKFEDALDYDVQELIDHQQRLITQGEGVLPPKPSANATIFQQSAANVRSAIGVSGEVARQLVEAVADGSQTTHQALTRAALALYYRQQQAVEHGSQA